MGDASLVYPGLWVGAKPPSERLSPTARVLVLTAIEYQPPTDKRWGAEVIRCPIPDDKLTVEQLRMVDDVAYQVANHIRDGRTVLCTCQMGLNRSALVACLAMCKLGIPSPDAIRRVRRARGPRAMRNEHFIKYLRAFGDHRAISASAFA